MNHINSYTRKKLSNRSAHQLFSFLFGYDVAEKLHSQPIDADEINENVISECLVKGGHTLYYYKPDSIHEIEFFIEKNGAVIPIEVKAGNRATPSLNQFIERYKPPYAYKLTNTQNGKADTKITLPHYMVMFIEPSLK